jgi:hypothetical protein
MDLYDVSFLLSTLWLGPFWFAMLLNPEAAKTHKLMKGPWFFAGPIAVWFLIFIFDSGSFSSTEDPTMGFVEAIALTLSSKSAFTATWAHVVVGDIFVTRWIWKRCLRLGLKPWFRRVSVFFGVVLMPVGLFLYFVFAKFHLSRKSGEDPS